MRKVHTFIASIAGCALAACAPPNTVVTLDALRGPIQLSMSPGSSPSLVAVSLALPLAALDDASCQQLDQSATAAVGSTELDLVDVGGGYSSIGGVGVPSFMSGCKASALFEGEVPLASLSNDSSTIVVDDSTAHLDLTLHTDGVGDERDILVHSPPRHPLLIGDLTPATDAFVVALDRRFAGYLPLDDDEGFPAYKIFVVNAQGDTIDPTRNEDGDVLGPNEVEFMDYPYGVMIMGGLVEVVLAGPATLVFQTMLYDPLPADIESCASGACDVGTLRLRRHVADVELVPTCGPSCLPPPDPSCSGSSFWNSDLAAETGTACGHIMRCGIDPNPATQTTVTVRCDDAGACTCSADDGTSGSFVAASPLCDLEPVWIESLVGYHSCTLGN
jgi:hypothetical protein